MGWGRSIGDRGNEKTGERGNGGWNVKTKNKQKY